MPTVWGGDESRVYVKNIYKEVILKAHQELQGILQELAEKGFRGGITLRKAGSNKVEQISLL